MREALTRSLGLKEIAKTRKHERDWRTLEADGGAMAADSA